VSSLVLELQAAAMDPNVKVADILRKALAVATKLGLSEFQVWCENELDGYQGPGVPGYRRLEGQIKARHSHLGWIPVRFPDSDLAKQLSVRDIGQSVGEIEHTVEHTTNEETIEVPLPHAHLTRFFGHTPQFRLGMVPMPVIERTHLFGILEAVRNTVLKWSLKLEQSGIMGQGMTFTRDEVQKATMATYNIHNFTGILGNVDSSQVQIGDYNGIHAELRRRGLSQAERNELETILDALPQAKQEDKPALLKRGTDWIARNAAALGTLSETIRQWFETLS
jgi:hypothetical protein